MPLPEGFRIRRASIADLEMLVDHREAMFRDMGYTDGAVMDAMSAKFRIWLREHMDAGNYHAWLVCAEDDSVKDGLKDDSMQDGQVVAGAGLWLMDWPPHMIGQGARRGNIVDVYTEQNFRRRGLARHVIETAIGWCRNNGVDTIVLHASPAGRSLYEAMGFTATNEMRIQL